MVAAGSLTNWRGCQVLAAAGRRSHTQTASNDGYELASALGKITRKKVGNEQHLPSPRRPERRFELAFGRHAKTPAQCLMAVNQLARAVARHDLAAAMHTIQAIDTTGKVT